MTQFQINARLHSIIKVHRANNEIIFVSADFLSDDFRKLQSRRLTLLVAESNGHATQEALPLPVVTPETPEPQMIVIKGQPVPKPRQTAADRFLVDDRARPCVARYRAWADKAREAFGGDNLPKLPKNIEMLTVRFYMSMPHDWSISKRLQLDGKRHFDRPDLDNLLKSVMDSLLKNDEIVAEIHATKHWTNGEPRTEVIFSE